MVTTKCPTSGASYYIADIRTKPLFQASLEGLIGLPGLAGLAGLMSFTTEITRKVFFKGPLSNEWTQLANTVFTCQPEYIT